MPFFSIIIPTYNRAQMLTTAIDSVLKQSFSDWELIVVDDGSTDNTKEVVNSYNDNRIRYIYQKNSERCAARNNGINSSKGNYICFLDSDDYYLLNRLEKLYNEIKKREFPIAFFYTGICFEDNGIAVRREELPNIFKSMKEYFVTNVIGSPQVCIHKNILLTHKYNENFSIGEDTELWIRIENERFPIIFLNQFTIIATNHIERSVNEVAQNSYKDGLKIMKFIFSKKHPGNKINPKVKRSVISGLYFGIARHYIYNCARFKALFYLLRSILITPTGNQTKHKAFLFYKTLFSHKSNISEIRKYISIFLIYLL
ncbi:MAG: glycosyltransferase family 2 protein [Bacteroidetes bacterium]|nr:glycosyltransferase family 2 protein [Bacteroidota bacterium]